MNASVDPSSAIANWRPAADRKPLNLLAAQETNRLEDLIPLRHERMGVSPFAFYRGTAIVMAADLASLGLSGPRAQLCGDAHIANFGAYASPERNVVFDVNDFDETLPGPWEWDVLRLAASVELAGLHREFEPEAIARAVSGTARAYREAMLELAQMPPLDLWYRHTTLEDLMQGRMADDRKTVERYLKQAKKRTAERLRPKITYAMQPRFIENPPAFRRPLPDDQIAAVLDEALGAYEKTLPQDVAMLYRRYQAKDLALKAVGVGSVGTVCAVVLLVTPRDEALILQIKEATASVLEPYVGASDLEHPGERVVQGQRAMQALSDPFLGWTSHNGRYYYVRQLRDMKVSPNLDKIDPGELRRYAGTCAQTLARAHARSGDPIAMATILERDHDFDEAVGAFARRYADQVAIDYREFVEKTSLPN